MREEMMVRRLLTEDQKEEYRALLEKKVLSLEDLQERQTEMRKQMQLELKEKKDDLLLTSRILRKGYTEQLETVDAMADLDKNVMEYYDKNGEVVSSRRLLPSERQETMRDV